MAEVVLRTKEREALENILKHPDNVRQYRRAQGLLWLAEGESVTTVAQRLRVRRQTIYNWIGQYRERRDEPVRERLQDYPHEGRPPRKLEQIRPILARLLPSDPQEDGYRATVWTAPLLCEHLRGVHGIEVSPDTLGVVIQELDYRWKRPRYGLKRCPKY